MNLTAWWKQGFSVTMGNYKAAIQHRHNSNTALNKFCCTGLSLCKHLINKCPTISPYKEQQILTDSVVQGASPQHDVNHRAVHGPDVNQHWLCYAALIIGAIYTSVINVHSLKRSI